MKDTHILVFEHDVLKYPPILSVIEYLFSINKKVILVGYCNEQRFINDFEKKGGVFIQVIENKTADNFVMKLYKYFLFKIRVSKVLKKYSNEIDRIWLFGEKCSWLLHNYLKGFEYNVYLFEIPSFKVDFRYRLLSINVNYKDILQNAKNVVCCEYNRAHITKAFFNLSELPTIIPNKPTFNELNIKNENPVLEEYFKRTKNKKVILYQGIFNYPERKLDWFCEAIDLLPEDFVLCLMGTENNYKKKLKNKYTSDRVLFLDYLSAPQHLLVTQEAYIGILVYNAKGNNICSTLNTLYCAPNKIYEYSKYGIPMLGNDIPALDYMFNGFKCGNVVDETDVESIKNAILVIDSQYNSYRKESFNFYNSVNTEKLYAELV